MSRKIRVLIADEPTALRDELLRVVKAQPDIEVVGETESGLEVPHLVGRLEPDVVLLDLAIPGGGLRAMEQLTER